MLRYFLLLVCVALPGWSAIINTSVDLTASRLNPLMVIETCGDSTRGNALCSISYLTDTVVISGAGSATASEDGSMDAVLFLSTGLGPGATRGAVISGALARLVTRTIVFTGGTGIVNVVLDMPVSRSGAQVADVSFGGTPSPTGVQIAFGQPVVLSTSLLIRLDHVTTLQGFGPPFTGGNVHIGHPTFTVTQSGVPVEFAVIDYDIPEPATALLTVSGLMCGLYLHKIRRKSWSSKTSTR